MPDRPETPDVPDLPDRPARPEPPMPRDGAGEDAPTYKLLGSTPGQRISRVLLLVGLALMLWVVFVLTRALS